MFGSVEEIPVAARPEAPRDFGQIPSHPGVMPDTVIHRQPYWWPTDDSWRSTMLPYQRVGSVGRLGNVDHMIPTPSGPVAVLGAGIGKPSRLDTVPIYQYGPSGQLVRVSRVSANNPRQWTTTAALPNTAVFERAEPVRWPTT